MILLINGMMMMMIADKMSLLILLLLYISSCVSLSDSSSHVENLQQLLSEGLVSTNNAIHTIFETWKIDEYPKFLKSCAMPRLLLSSLLLSSLLLSLSSLLLLSSLLSLS